MDNEQYLTEVREALENDPQRLGDVWRLTKEGKSPDEIAEELDVSTTGFVYNIKSFIKAIENGDLSESPTMAGSCGRALRGFIKRGRECEYLSPETIQELERRAEECDRRASNPQALKEEDAQVEKQTNQAVESGVAGIYVYTYPHYYRHPVVQETDDTYARTYLKIGISKRDASERVMQQTTGMPEPPMLLQIWVIENDDDLRKIEKRIHDHLRTIGHGGRQRKEWFLTNEQSVESTAKFLGLKLHYPETND